MILPGEDRLRIVIIHGFVYLLSLLTFYTLSQLFWPRTINQCTTSSHVFCSGVSVHVVTAEWGPISYACAGVGVIQLRRTKTGACNSLLTWELCGMMIRSLPEVQMKGGRFGYVQFDAFCRLRDLFLNCTSNWDWLQCWNWNQCIFWSAIQK